MITKSMVSGLVSSTEVARNDREILSLTNRSKTPKINSKDGAGTLKRLCIAELTNASKIDKNTNNTIGIDFPDVAIIII